MEPTRTNLLPRGSLAHVHAVPAVAASSHFPELPAPPHCLSLQEQRTGKVTTLPEVTSLSDVPAATLPARRSAPALPGAPLSSVTLGPWRRGALEEDALRTFWASPRTQVGKAPPGDGSANSSINYTVYNHGRRALQVHVYVAVNASLELTAS